MTDEARARHGETSLKPIPDPTELTTLALRDAIDQLEKLQNQRFEGLDKTLAIMERQRVEQKTDSYRELTAAFEAAQKLVSLTNIHVEQQLAQMLTTSNEVANGLRRDIDAVKERIGAVENQRLGAKEDRTGLYATIGVITMLLLFGLTVVGFMATK